MAPMTPERVAAMQALEAAATKGPWSVGNTRKQNVHSSLQPMWETAVHVGEGPRQGNALLVVGLGGDGALSAKPEAVEANAAFIAESRTFVPDLLAAYEAATQWLPIETAPKDGTPVLLTDDTGNLAVSAWRLVGGKSVFHGIGNVEHTETFGWLCGFEPTHWLPLPAPPVQETA